MNLLENIRLGLDSLLANKVRAFLTMLGIIIGIASVIGILTVGTAMSNSVNSSLNSFGGSNLFVYLSSKSDSFGGSTDDEDLINLEQINALKDKLGTKAKAVTFSLSGGSGQIKDKRNYANVSLEGVGEGNQYVDNLKILKGRYITEADVSSESNVAVVSDKFVNNMFSGDLSKALGKTVVYYDGFEDNVESFKIVGIYRYEVQGGMFGGGASTSEKELSTPVYIPHPIAHNLTGEKYLFFNISVTAQNSELVESVEKGIKDYFDNVYKNNELWEVTVQSTKKILEEVESVTNNIRLAIAVIAGISLLVGGIGVMNIMLVSVTERTREIGIRKALGATNSDIRLQFIIESMIVCLIGGAIGVLIGGSFGYMAGIFLNSPTYPSIGSIIFSVGFSMSIGLFFGYYPANKAAKLNPIDALRYE